MRSFAALFFSFFIVSYSAVFFSFFMMSCAARPPDKRPAVGDDMYEETGDEFDKVEALKEDPLDPRRADIEDLLSIPGFPRSLAMRVIEVVGETSGRKGWINRLTPPERNTLYLYEGFLVLPDRPSARISSRLLEDGLGSNDSKRTDCFFSCLADAWKLFARGRNSSSGTAASFYLSSSVLSGSFNLSFGDFSPDFAMGLVFSGYPSSYVFSGGYPFRLRRWIVQRTSFYGNSLRGFAVEAWKGPLRVALFMGRPRVYRSGRITVEESSVYGGRAGIRFHRVEFGATLSRGSSPSSGYIFTADGGWRLENIRVGGELACHEWGRFAGTWGLSFKGGVYGAGVLAYIMPTGFGSEFEGSAWGTGGTGSLRRGFSVVLSRRIFRRAEFRSAFERAVSQDAYETKGKETVRAELGKRWRRLSLKLSWQLKRYEEFETVPYPGDDHPSISRAYNFNVLLVRESRRCRLRAAVRCPWGRLYSGLLFAPSLRFPLFFGKTRVTVAAFLYHSMKGVPVFYFYEPSFEGGYPWRSARGSGFRGIFILEASARWFGLLWKASIESGGVPETGLQVSFKL